MIEKGRDVVSGGSRGKSADNWICVKLSNHQEGRRGGVREGPGSQERFQLCHQGVCFAGVPTLHGGLPQPAGH